MYGRLCLSLTLLGGLVGDWKQHLITAGIAMLVVALAHNGVLSFIPGMPPKTV
jgi:hypothetical protein